MDRPIIYAGAVPYDTDLLRLGRYSKEAIGRLAEIVLGSHTIMASGFECRALSTDLALEIGPGTIVAPYQIDRTHIGSITAGLAARPATTQCLFYHDETQRVPVSLTGARLTVFAICNEIDDCPDVLPFYNADQPDQTMAGPDNRGKALPTRRTGRIAFEVATRAPSCDGALVVPLLSLDVPAAASDLDGIVPEPGAVFLPDLTALATREFAQQIAQPPEICATSRVVTIPVWARQVELRAIGGGGGGGSCTALSPEEGAFSGAGGGAGGDSWGIYALDPARDNALSITIGLGGAPDSSGESSFVTYGGELLLRADGGNAGYFSDARIAAGGSGGGAGGGTLWNQNGGAGSDGQHGMLVFAGNGGEGPWGGAGKAGFQAGVTASKYGAGGGGAYTARAAGENTAGGRGFQGCVLYRFLR